MPLALKSHARRRNERLQANWEGWRHTQTKRSGRKSPADWGISRTNSANAVRHQPGFVASRRLGVLRQSIGERSNPNVA